MSGNGRQQVGREARVPPSWCRKENYVLPTANNIVITSEALAAGAAALSLLQRRARCISIHGMINLSMVPSELFSRLRIARECVVLDLSACHRGKRHT